MMGSSANRNGANLHSSIQIQPSKYLTLSWTNLGYKVPTSKGGTKEILKNLNGIVKPGNIVAVLGASGAGKSSFLNVLAGRVPVAHTTGKIAVNGKTDLSIKHASRYCTQDEALFGNLTVFETLHYAADFNLPKSKSKKEKEHIIHKLLEEFGLLDVKNTKIGTPLLKGCSGGQIRRVSVVAQLIGLVNEILFLDEPTSGLDSVAASAIISSVCSLAKRQNIPVIATIHQPSTETFELFTHCLILGQGSTVYFGPREAAITYFESIGFPIPIRSNPADVYLQLTNTDFSAEKQIGSHRVQTLCRYFENSPMNQTHIQEIQSLHSRPLSHPMDTLGYTNGFMYQTSVLFARAFVNATKNPLAYWIRVAMYIALAILMGTTWFRMDTYQSTVQDRLAGLFFAVAFLSFMAVAGIPAFLEERLVFMRESANGLYNVESYILSNLLISIPFIFIITISFSLVAYFLMSLNGNFENFLIFAAYLFLSLMIAEAQTVFISVTIPIFVAALAITAFTNGLWMVVQGFFVQKENIPGFWKYSFHQIDFQKYSYELLLKNEMRDLVFQCDKTVDGLCSCIIPRENSTSCEFTGDDVLRYYDYGDISYWKYTIILLSIFLFFKIGTYLVLKFKSRSN